MNKEPRTIEEAYDMGFEDALATAQTMQPEGDGMAEFSAMWEKMKGRAFLEGWCAECAAHAVTRKMLIAAIVTAAAGWIWLIWLWLKS
jgi:hypothetical protein